MKFSLTCHGLTSDQTKRERLRVDLRGQTQALLSKLHEAKVVHIGEGNNFCTSDFPPDVKGQVVMLGLPCTLCDAFHGWIDASSRLGLHSCCWCMRMLVGHWDWDSTKKYQTTTTHRIGEDPFLYNNIYDTTTISISNAWITSGVV